YYEREQIARGARVERAWSVRLLIFATAMMLGFIPHGVVEAQHKAAPADGVMPMIGREITRSFPLSGIRPAAGKRGAHTASGRRHVDQSITVSSNSIGNRVSVTARNDEYSAVPWTPTRSSVSESITRCDGPGQVSIPGRSSKTANITFDASTGPGSGSFTVDEIDNGTETIYVTIAAPDVRVVITPQSATVTVPPGTPQTASFTVQNTGTDATSYSLTAECGGLITCGVQPGPVTLQPGAQTSTTLPEPVAGV
ncbi:MAG: hypothetical protein ACR2M1_07790, partial [Gemmatimonadaceae bacterium]